MKELLDCPICKSDDEVVPIQINLHSNVKRVNLINNTILPIYFERETETTTTFTRCS